MMSIVKRECTNSAILLQLVGFARPRLGLLAEKINIQRDTPNRLNDKNVRRAKGRFEQNNQFNDRSSDVVMTVKGEHISSFWSAASERMFRKWSALNHAFRALSSALLTL